MTTLLLPVPPSPNTWPSNPFALQVAKDRYRGECWVAAIAQTKPYRDPPEHVTVSATLYYARHPRDEDGLSGSLKWTLDALRQRQRGRMRWRQGIADECGYFVDDDPQHLTLADVSQQKVATVAEERLELKIVQPEER